MRILSATLALCAASLLTTSAYAGTVDDFALTGPGVNLSFSYGATYTFPDQLHLVQLPTFRVTGAVNGTQGDIIDVSLYSLNNTNGETLSLAYYTPAFLSLGSLDLYEGGPLYQVDPQTGTPGNYIDSLTFLPGTYPLATLASYPSDPYTLTITPEASDVPEPASLTLLATGALTFLASARRRTH